MEEVFEVGRDPANMDQVKGLRLNKHYHNTIELRSRDFFYELVYFQCYVHSCSSEENYENYCQESYSYALLFRLKPKSRNVF